MRVLIVDDERPARDKLRRLLTLEADVSAIDEAADACQALQAIAAAQPDLILLDVQMPEVSGIELAASLPNPAPLVVFVTAHDHYAIKAFDANAIDYLLKPFDQARLQRALQRTREQLAYRSTRPSFDTGTALRQLLVTERGVTRVIQVDQIAWIETADNYVVLHTSTDQPLLRQTLSGLLAKLGAGFMRCHRRAAVQLNAIERVVTDEKGDADLVLRDGQRVPCSRQYRAAVVASLKTLIPAASPARR